MNSNFLKLIVWDKGLKPLQILDGIIIHALKGVAIPLLKIPPERDSKERNGPSIQAGDFKTHTNNVNGFSRFHRGGQLE